MRSDQRQQQILDCAKRVFAARGFHAASISHICAEAGIGRGTLYQYFQNKKAVLVAILRQALDRIGAMVREGTEQPHLPPEKLTRAVVVEWVTHRLHSMLSVVFQDEPTLRILLREAVGLDGDVEHILAEIDGELIRIIENDLRISIERGIVRELDPRVAATLMVGGVEKLAIASLRSDRPVDLLGLAREVATLHAVGVLSNRIGKGT